MSGPSIECVDCRKIFQLKSTHVTTWCRAVTSDEAGKANTTVHVAHVYNHCQPWYKEIDTDWKSTHEVLPNTLPEGFTGMKIKWTHPDDCLPADH